MNSQTANENNKPSTKRQKTSENSDSNEILSMTEGSTDEKVAGPSNVRNGKIDESAESSTTDTAAKNDTLNSNTDEDDAVDARNIDALNADAPAEDQTADILKLDIDCFEEAFDYLRCGELISVGKTCKRLQQVAGYLFHQNYSHYGLYAYSQTIRTNLAYFISFIRQIRIDNIKELEYFLQTQSKFRRLKQVMMILLDFTKIEIGRLLTMAIWSKLEVLCVESCTLNNNFQEILNICTKLKRLEIMWCQNEYNWFDRKYPTLEYLKLHPWHRESLKGIPRFLELNPNIRKFAITSFLFWENRDKMLTSDIKLDNLAISFEYERGSQFQSMCNLLNELHKRGFYTKLQLYSWGALRQEKIDQLASVEGLNKLHVSSCGAPISLSSLTNLDEIYVNDSDFIADLKILPNSLINLKRIDFYKVSFDDIMPFIKRSVEIQRIKVNRLKTGAHFNRETKVIDLRALNREREKLPDAARITLYVYEEIYLATKWAFGEIDLGLIRLRRDTSFEWIHDF